MYFITVLSLQDYNEDGQLSFSEFSDLVDAFGNQVASDKVQQSHSQYIHIFFFTCFSFIMLFLTRFGMLQCCLLFQRVCRKKSFSRLQMKMEMVLLAWMSQLHSLLVTKRSKSNTKKFAMLVSAYQTAEESFLGNLSFFLFFWVVFTPASDHDGLKQNALLESPL